MAAAARWAVGAAGHGAEGLAEVAGEAGGNHTAAIDVGFDHYHYPHQSGDNAVALRKGLSVRGPTQRKF